MTINTITNEAKRGCGYRKEGGLYLMSGGPEADCGKLPLALDRCPCCGAGIKFARGWTWVNGKLLFADRKCSIAGSMPQVLGEGCCGCVLGNPPEKMGLVWVGEKFYPTPADFLKEGMAQGVSRRVNTIPHDFKLGETWILFAHMKAVTKTCPDCNGKGANADHDAMLLGPGGVTVEVPCKKCEGTGEVKGPAIFGCFHPTRIEYIVKADDDEEKLAGLEKRGITLVKLVRTDNAGLFDKEEKEEA